MSSAQPRIYADFNAMELSPRVQGMTCIDLHRRGSLQDLCHLGLELVEGMALRVYQDSDEVEDIEVAGVAFFDAKTRRCVPSTAPSCPLALREPGGRALCQ
ncbi:MAG: hypothetical protein AAGA54_27695 [Myxococcota bacterium]